jgi:outer membrane protein
MPSSARLLLALLIPLAAVAGDSSPVSRPGVLHLTHESAMHMALAKSFAIQVESFSPKIAREDVRGEWGRFDPVFDVQYRRSEDTRRTVFESPAPLTPGAVAGESDPRATFVNGALRLDRRSIGQESEFSTGFGGLTPWGLRYDLGLGTRDISGTGNMFANDVAATASSSVVQPLLRDFGFAANMRGVRIARNNAFASEWAFRQRVIDILTTVDFVYNELHSAHERLKVAERSRELARQLLDDNRKRVEIGVKSPLDVTEARAQVAAREEAVILARRVVRDNENLLKQLVTNDLESMLSVAVEIEPPPSPPFRADVPAGIRLALELRPDYRQAVLNLQSRDIVLAYTRNQKLPRFDLTGSLSLLGFDNDQGTAINRAARRDDETVWTIGAIMSIPVGNRTARAAEAGAKFEVAQQLVRLQQLEQQIVVDVDNASGQIVTSRERIASTEEARKLAFESLDAGQERLKAGAGTTFEVLELQEKLSEAEAAEIRARADYNKAVAEYYRQTGTTLREYGAAVE